MHQEQHERAARQRKIAFIGFLVVSLLTAAGVKIHLDQQPTIPPQTNPPTAPPSIHSETKTDFGNLLTNFSYLLWPGSSETPEPPPTDKLFALEEKEHPKMNPKQIQKFLDAGNKVFPGPKISALAALSVIYTEAGFGSLETNWAGARGAIQLTPFAATETISKLGKLMENPSTRSQTADFFTALDLPNDPKSLAALTKNYQKNIDVSNAIGVLHLQQSVNYLDSEITKDKLEGLPIETLALLQGSLNYSPLAPAYILADLKGTDPKAITPADIDRVLTDWKATNGRTFTIIDHYDKDNKPVYKNIFYDPDTIQELRSYFHRLEYFQSFLLEAARLANEGKIEKYPKNFTSTVSQQVNRWLVEDLKSGSLLKTPSSERQNLIKAMVTPTP